MLQTFSGRICLVVLPITYQGNIWFSRNIKATNRVRVLSEVSFDNMLQRIASPAAERMQQRSSFAYYH